MCHLHRGVRLSSLTLTRCSSLRCVDSSPVLSSFPVYLSLFPCVPLPPVDSYGGDGDDDDISSSSDSEDEVLKQFEISVSRSQSFRTSAAAANSSEQQSQQVQLSLGRRHKFTRLSDHEEGSTEPSDCEGTDQNMSAGCFLPGLGALTKCFAPNSCL